MIGWRRPSLITILVVVVGNSSVAAGSLDVPAEHWAHQAVQRAVAAGILEGYDGAFHGERPLDRYQIAVVVARLLERLAAQPIVDHWLADGDDEKARLFSDLEALVLEFSDELVQLGVRAGLARQQLQELRHRWKADAKSHIEDPEPGTFVSGLGSFGFIVTDEDSEDGFVDRGTLRNDQRHFELFQLSLGVGAYTRSGLCFHAQLDFDGTVNGPGDGVSLNEVYLARDDMLGAIGMRFGAFALPFSWEHDGPFRTSRHTITPSLANSLMERVRGLGVEFHPARRDRPGDIMWRFAIVSGVETFGLDGRDGFVTTPVSLSDALASSEGRLGSYVFLEQRPHDGERFGWNLGFFHNGGEDGFGVDVGPDEVDTFLFSGLLEWEYEDMLFFSQYMRGRSRSFDEELRLLSWNMMVTFLFRAQRSFSIRYERSYWERDGVDEAELAAFVFAYNHPVSSSGVLQLEYLTPDNRFNDVENIADDVLQLRYKVAF